MQLHCITSARQTRGFSLVELLCAVGSVAILSAIALPGFRQFQRSAARAAAVNDFMHSIFLARSQAILLNGVVSLCRSKDGQTCTTQTSNWDSGWIVFVNDDADRPVSRDAGELIIQRHAGWRGGRVTSNRDAFSFRPTSQLDVNGTVLFCDLDGGSADARAIVISHTGRPRVSKRDAENRPLSCT